MKAVPFAAFGHVIFMCDAQAGDITSLPVNDKGQYDQGFYFFTYGLGKVILVETGESLSDRVPGWLTGEATNGYASRAGNAQCTFMQETRWVCLPFNKNPKQFPKLSSLILKKDQAHVFKMGSNMFLGEGTIIVNDKVFKAPAQIRVRSGDANVACIEEAYLLDFTNPV